MTKQKAIEILENHTQYKCAGEDLVALEMAIEALKQKSYNAISYLEKYCENKQNTDKVEISVLQLQRIIEALRKDK